MIRAPKISWILENKCFFLDLGSWVARNALQSIGNYFYSIVRIVFLKINLSPRFVSRCSGTPRDYCAKRLLRPGPRKLEMSVCPSVRPFVRPFAIYVIFAKSIWTPDTLRSPSQNEHFCVAEQNPKSLTRMLPLMCKFWWSLFWSKTVFLPKKYHRLLGMKTYENHQNRCSLTVCFWVDLVKNHSFPVDAHVTQRMTRSIIFAISN